MLFENCIIFPVLSFEKFLNSLLCPNSPLSFFLFICFDLLFAKIDLSFWLSLCSHIIRIQEKTAWKLSMHIHGVCVCVCVCIWSVWDICIGFGICGLCVCVAYVFQCVWYMALWVWGTCMYTCPLHESQPCHGEGSYVTHWSSEPCCARPFKTDRS